MSIRILQALTTGDLGGTELMVLQLVSGLNRSFFTSEVSCLDGPGPVSNCFQEINVPVYDLSGSGGVIGAMWRLFRLVRQKEFDIIHLYGFRMSLIGRLVACTIRPRPIVIHGIRGLHVTEGEEIRSLKTKAAIAVERIAAWLIDVYIANSHGAARFLTSKGIPQFKCFVIPNGIDISEWNGRRVRRVPEVTEIICVANFRPRKRHCDLVEALAVLQGKGMRLRCILLGDGSTRREVEYLVRERHLMNVVEFLGRREPQEVKNLLREGDIFVLPSLWEGLPRSVMEAMAAGLPVIGTDVNGISELVVHGETGFLVPPKEPAALAGRIEKLVNDTDLRRRMGEIGRLRITREFSLAKMVRSYEHVYKDLVQRKPEAVPTN